MKKILSRIKTNHIKFMCKYTIAILWYFTVFLSILLISILLLRGFKNPYILLIVFIFDFIAILGLMFERPFILYIIHLKLYENIEFDKYKTCLSYLDMNGEGMVRELNRYTYVLGNVDLLFWQGHFSEAYDMLKNLKLDNKYGVYYLKNLLLYYEKEFLINIFLRNYDKSREILEKIEKVKIPKRHKIHILNKLNAVYTILVENKSNDFFVNTIYDDTLEYLFYNNYILSKSYYNKGDRINFESLKSDLIKENSKLFFVNEMRV